MDRARLRLEILEDRLAPAVLTVNTTADVFHPTDGTLSLRNAITAVNAGNENGMTASERSQVSGTFGVNDTIQFANSLSGQTITLSGSALWLTQNVTITGLGASNLAISGNNQSGVFTIGYPALVSISGLTIEDGYNNIHSVGGGGGAIDNSGTVMLNNVTLSGNSADEGGGIYNGGTVMLNNVTLTGNSAQGGGGILTYQGSVTLNNCTLAGNSAQFGGGIAEHGSTLTVSNSTLANNSASEGGGIWYAINGVSTAELDNTIVADSISGGDLYRSQHATFSGSNDLIGDGSYLSDFGPNSLSGDPLLAPLGYYGGPTETMALLHGSAAIGVGDPSQNGGTDQRGFGRGSSVDIGAFQTQTSPLLVNTNDDTASGAEPAGQMSLRDAINLASISTAPHSPITFAVVFRKNPQLSPPTT